MSEQTAPDLGAFVQDYLTWDRWTVGALSESFQEGIEHTKLYLGSRRDHRKPWEKTWRAHTMSPYPWIIVQGATAATTDVITANDPLIQIDGIGDEDVDIGRKVEKLVDLTFRQNQFRMRVEEMVRESKILGTTAIKLVWRHDTSRVRSSDPGYEAQFDQDISAAQQLGIQPPADPQEYEAWRRDTEATQGIAFPQHPRARFEEVTTFRGPSIERIPLTTLRFDPMEGDWSKQRRTAQVIVKPQKWVLDRAGEGPEFPFRRAEVEAAISAMPADKFDQWVTNYATLLKVGAATTGWYGRKDLCILHEVFDPEDEEMPYKIILNELKVINKDPFPPYGHGECPVHLFRNVTQPGMALGTSELKAPRKLFDEFWALRDLRLDGVTLATLPILVRLQELGIPELGKVWRPGNTIPVPRMDVLKKLDLGSGPHPDIWREIEALKAEIDDSSSVTTQLRGSPATVGRVSASEAERRFSSAQLRMKIGAMQFEEELRRPVRQMIYLWYQYGQPEELVRIGGQGTDAYATTVSKEELLRALDYDFNLRGPSRAASRDMLVQQAMQWFGSFGALLAPYRQLAFAAQTYELMGLKGRNQVLPDSDIQAAQQAAMMPPPAVDANGNPLPQAPAAAPAPAQEMPAQAAPEEGTAPADGSQVPPEQADPAAQQDQMLLPAAA